MAVSKLQKDKKSANKMYDPLNKMYDPFSLDISGEEYLYEYKKNGKVKSKKLIEHVKRWFEKVHKLK